MNASFQSAADEALTRFNTRRPGRYGHPDPEQGFPGRRILKSGTELFQPLGSQPHPRARKRACSRPSRMRRGWSRTARPTASRSSGATNPASTIRRNGTRCRRNTPISPIRNSRASWCCWTIRSATSGCGQSRWTCPNRTGLTAAAAPAGAGSDAEGEAQCGDHRRLAWRHGRRAGAAATPRSASAAGPTR